MVLLRDVRSLRRPPDRLNLGGQPDLQRHNGIEPILAKHRAPDDGAEVCRDERRDAKQRQSQQLKELQRDQLWP